MVLPFIYTRQEAGKVGDKIWKEKGIACLPFRVTEIKPQFLTREQLANPDAYVVLVQD